MRTRRDLLAVAGTLGLAACVSPAAVLPPPWWAPYVTVAPALVSQGLRDLHLVRARNVGGFLRITGTYTNVSQNRLSALYRFTWLDMNGQPVDSILATWEALHARSGTRADFAGTAPRSDIDSFRLELIPAGGG